MSMPARLIPNQPVPPLRVKTVGGPCWRLCDQKPQHFTLVLFYRGLHCGFCKTQLQTYEARYEEFRQMAGAIRPTRLVMEDALKNGEISVLTYENMNVRDLPERMFTREYLRRLQQ